MPANLAHSTEVDACIIRAASLEYSYEDMDDEAVLTTCDSFKCGGQIEPADDAVLSDCEHVLVRQGS